MKRRLYVDGNTVYGIDEDCMRKKEKEKEREQENYLIILLSASYKNEIER